jgi:hypothetical protein
MAVVIGLENGQVLIFKVVHLPATCSSLTLATFAGASGFASNVAIIAQSPPLLSYNTAGCKLPV